MSNPFPYLWRHPRRTGFIAFNAVVLVALILWGIFTESMSREGIAGLPNVVLGYAGMAFMGLVWVVGWIAWIVLIMRREARRRA